MGKETTSPDLDSPITKNTGFSKSLPEAKPTVLIGTTAQPGIFSEHGATRDVPARRLPDYLRAEQSDVESRVHARGSDSMDKWEGHHRHRLGL